MDTKEIEKIAGRIPEESWKKIVNTACEVFVKVIYPITATTEGIGRLIERKFNSLNEEQQVIASKCINDAANKISNFKSQNSKRPIKPEVVYEALDNSDKQTDETIRELWSNLLAKEFSQGDVHPEIARALSRITAQDALLLVKIAESETNPISIRVLKVLASGYTLGIFGDKKTFSHVHLESLGVIHEVEKNWFLTVKGRELIRSVSDPDLKETH